MSTERSGREGTAVAVLAGDQRLSSAQRHHPVADPRDLSDAEDGLCAQLRAGRADDAGASMLTASLLQPLVGWYTDRRPMPYSLVIGHGVLAGRAAAAGARADLRGCSWSRRC